jgi:osmotically-inducible protein OsmY
LIALVLGCVTGAAGSGGCASSGSMSAPAPKDDSGMARLIARRFADDPRLCPFAISVAVQNRVAHLQGKVASQADSRRAAKLALDAGATSVDDRLIIDPSAGEAGMC